MLLVGKHKKTGLFEKKLTLVVVGFHSGTQMGHTKTRKMGLFLCPLGPISYWKTKWGSLTHFLRPIRTGFALMRKICCPQLTQMWAEAGLSPVLALPRYWSKKSVVLTIWFVFRLRRKTKETSSERKFLMNKKNKQRRVIRCVLHLQAEIVVFGRFANGRTDGQTLI